MKIRAPITARRHSRHRSIITVPLLLPADTIHVPGDQPTIQDGIAAASNGDTGNGPAANLGFETPDGTVLYHEAGN